MKKFSLAIVFGLFIQLHFSVLSQVTLTDSDLPIVVITTPPGETINDVTRTFCDMGIIDNGPGVRNYMSDPFNHYDGKISIEIRGSTSQQYPKKNYGFETQNQWGENLNYPLLGLPVENDWILYGPYPDKTLTRNVLTYNLSRMMGHYASNSRYCEVVIDGNYKGLYILLERIKVDNNRVDITPLESWATLGLPLTGGYIVKVDKLTGEVGFSWPSNFNNEVIFQFHDPEYDELVPVQVSYMQNFLSEFENTVNGPLMADPVEGYSKYINTESFYDFFILQELGRTVDGYRSSSFMYKDRDDGMYDGKLVAGPMWDFNLSYGNADYCDADLTTGWQYNFDEICDFTTAIPFWWERLLDAPSYRNGLKCRWEELRSGPLHNDLIHGMIDSLVNLAAEARIRNFQRWPIIGVYVNWNGFVGQTYEEDVDYLKSYFVQRASWMDQNLPGICDLGIEEEKLTFEIWPNPTDQFLHLNTNIEFSSIFISDLLGRKVKEIQEVGQGQIDVSDLPSGTYSLSITTEGAQSSKCFIKK
jgi:hypothetical protein